MTARTILATGMLLASTTAWAQSPPGAEKTTEDLVCQLSVECAEEAAGPVEQAAPGAAPIDRAGPRVSATKGFKISREGKAATTAPRATATSRFTVAPRVGAPASSESSDYFRIEKKSSEFAPGKATGIPEWRADLRVSFVAGSAQLTEAGRGAAQKFASALGSPLFAGMRFTIEGHTDAVGARAFNVDLSKRRAQAVVDYLVAGGAERSRFNVIGYGFDKPLDGRAASDAANRRVEVVLVK